MSAIITITLNPAIDKSTSVKAMIPEKKMKCMPPVFEPGGGGVNVARALKKLGAEATAIFLAGGYTGKFFIQLLDKEHIQMVPVEIAGHTRENLVVVDHAANLQYRFGMPGPSIREDEWKDLLKKIEKLKSTEYIIASGSVPAGIPDDIFARIGAIAKTNGARFIVDTSGAPLQQAVNKGVYLLKPNLGELSFLAGRPVLQAGEVEDAARSIIGAGKCEVIVVSMGPTGALLVTKELVRHIVPPVVKIKSTVGAGDSMVAGIIFALIRKKSLAEAVQYGVACGTAATLNPGTELCRKEDADRIHSGFANTGVLS